MKLQISIPKAFQDRVVLHSIESSHPPTPRPSRSRGCGFYAFITKPEFVESNKRLGKNTVSVSAVLSFTIQNKGTPSGREARLPFDTSSHRLPCENARRTRTNNRSRKHAVETRVRRERVCVQFILNRTFSGQISRFARALCNVSTPFPCATRSV